MRTLVLMAFALITFGAFNALANDLCLLKCADSIAVDSGNSANACLDGDFCECTASALACSSVKLVCSTCSCPTGYGSHGRTVKNYKCCAGGCFNSLEEAELAQMEVQSTNEEGLDDVFEADFSATTSEYYGYVNTTNRSPSAGRGYQKTAKLDACVGYGNTNNMTGLLDCMSNYCPDSNKNSYCYQTGTNNGSSTPYAVCKDRCECQFNSANCENL